MLIISGWSSKGRATPTIEGEWMKAATIVARSKHRQQLVEWEDGRVGDEGGDFQEQLEEGWNKIMYLRKLYNHGPEFL